MELRKYKIDLYNITEEERVQLVNILTELNEPIYHESKIRESYATFAIDHILIFDGVDWMVSDGAYKHKTMITIDQFITLAEKEKAALQLFNLIDVVNKPEYYYKTILTKELGKIILFPTGILILSTNMFIPHSQQTIL